MRTETHTRKAARIAATALLILSLGLGEGAQKITATNEPTAAQTQEWK